VKNETPEPTVARDPRIVLTGGGTGGHVYPALAVAVALRKLQPGVELLYIGGDRIEKYVVPQAGLPFRSISVHGIAGRKVPLLQRLRALFEIAIGLPLIQSIRIIREFHPDAVLGTGGYVSGPVLLAARVLRIPAAALDGNRVPGHTSRLVARLVDVMAVAHPEMVAFFKGRVRKGTRVEATGLPIRDAVVKTSRDESATALRLDPWRQTLVVLGGSLGSDRINKAVTGAVRGLAEVAELHGLQVIHVTGERYAAQAREGRWNTLRYRSLGYAGPEAFALADLIVSRAGASSVAEITARGLAAVLIPWADASTGEQMMNAEPVERAGGAVLIPDAELTPQRLYEVLRELLIDRERLQKMANASKGLGKPEAAAQVAKLVLNLRKKSRRGF